MPKRDHRKPSRLPQILAIGGLVLLVVVILAFKEKSPAEGPSASSNERPEAQLERALAENLPTLAFFHSNNCQQCIVMTETVAKVYPEFSASVALVDVNVYDERNTALLNKVGLQYSPTLIFYDHHREEQISVGVLEAEQLRQTLAALADGD